MKLCEPHWALLKENVEVMGLGGLVSRDQAQLLERFTGDLERGAPLPENYDPLMQANFMIFSRALQLGGLYLMGSKDDGSEFCPLCELNEHAPVKPADVDPELSLSDVWIRGCVKSIAQHCRDLGLIPKLQ